MTSAAPATGGDGAAGGSGAAAAPAPPTAPAAPATRRLAALLLLLAALGALGLATLGAAADRGPGIRAEGGTTRELRTVPVREQSPEPLPPTPVLPSAAPRPPGDGTAATALLVVLGIALAAAALWVLLRLRLLSRPAPAVAGEVEEDELTPEQARAALEEAREQLSTLVHAQDAVIAAWLSLERAIAEAGVRRHPAQTTLEFVVAVLGDLDLDRRCITAFADLYRRALFDDRPLLEADRDEALALLDVLTADLDRSSTPGDAR